MENNSTTSFFEKADVLPFMASHFVGGCFVAGAGVVSMFGNVYVFNLTL